MKIAIDFEDVIYDLTTELIEFYKKTGKNVTFEEIDNYKWFDMELVEKSGETQNIENMKPLEKAIESVQSLMKNKDKLYIITDKNIKFKDKVEKWLHNHLNLNNIILIYTNGEKKSKICKEHNIQLILEDSGENALDCAQEGIKVILFDKPWNRNHNHKNIIRINSWIVALEKIKELKKHKQLKNHLTKLIHDTKSLSIPPR